MPRTAASFMLLCLQDMGGAALMLALSHVIISAQLPVRLRLLLPAVENAVSGSSYRPGDVLQTRAGITVENGNTDAEGRSVCGDGLQYVPAGCIAP
jgi:leucyl aminopeptidase